MDDFQEAREQLLPALPAPRADAPTEAVITLHTWMAHVHDAMRERRLIPALGGFEYREGLAARLTDTPSNYAARFEAFLSEPLG